MKLKTKQFGEIEFSDDLILNFKEGLVGFETLRKFILIKPEDTLFYWLNSVENPDIAFPLFGLRLIDEEYPQVENHEAFGIVILNPDPLKITVNMKAPVYVNQENKTGYQKILDDEKYSLYYNLFTE
ncbi:MAG: flagellar assembly protein FliW [Melioribacter sp.]|jgi:flagellar assembly factor FliW|uniref:flagellar assembly protein FliW n=1 Tax=Melioribacter sp. TaxID=2052167 RepID=UPI003BE8FACC